jgi:5-methylcytosine-specific restriction protein A|uniref:HNH endonuclease bacteriophage, HNH Endonuclease, DNA.52A n=1 Tax=Siphoviridae sp. ctGuJ10 TaxID=2825418 RepID=A0A8S5PSV7_9CAUD|nr:MAG TPA: HNH endonuclease bacteriophage, HNH Endonuclease, DNA.52A [Siphoviridae sp. ctGuJ10]
MIKRICAYPRCNHIINDDQRYCEYHAIKYQNRVKQYHKNYNNKNSNNKIRKYYWTDSWKDKRHYILVFYYYIDIYKLIYDHEIVIADMVHHIVPTNDDFSLRAVDDNLIPLNDATHKLVHKEYLKGRKEMLDMQKKLIKCKEIFFKQFKID